MNTYFFLEVEVPETCHDCGGSDEGNLSHKLFNFDEMLKDPKFRQELNKRGWVDSISFDRNSTTLGPRLAVLGKSYGNDYQGKLIDKKTSSGVDQILRYQDAFFAIEVNREAIKDICPEGYKTMLAYEAHVKGAEKARKEAEAKRKKRAEETKAAKEQKKLETARLLLEQQGFKVEK